MITSIDPQEFRRTIGMFATGVTVITARDGELIHGMTANSVTSVSLDPLLVLVCVDRRARMAGIIGAAGRFAINVLGEQQEAISRHFAGRPDNGLHVPFDMLDGVPTIRGTLARISCTIDQQLDGGDHLIVIGRVDAIARADGKPLLYFAGHYRQIAPDRHAATSGAEEDFYYHNIISFV